MAEVRDRVLTVRLSADEFAAATAWLDARARRWRAAAKRRGHAANVTRADVIRRAIGAVRGAK